MESRRNNNKIIVILGPTSSGKSGVAIRLAKKFNGEIISADSRQIYRGMDVGTGKITRDNLNPSLPSGDLPAGRHGISRNRDREGKTFYSEGIAHYGIDIINPKTEFNVTKFKKYADKIIADILHRGKLPIICGGTGFWIKSIVDNIIYPEVKPNIKLRNQLRNYPKEKLFAMLQKLDPTRAKNIDRNNPVRLIRAIEICKTLGKVPSIKNGGSTSIMEVEPPKHNYLQIGIKIPKEKLHKNIKKRLEERFKAGMIEEVQKLHSKDGLSWKRLASFGLGYRLIPKFFKKEIKTEKELFQKVYQSEKDYAKRQMTWFRKDKRIVWLSNYKDIENLVKSFTKK